MKIKIRYTDFAEEFILQESASPFFLFFSFQHVHFPQFSIQSESASFIIDIVGHSTIIFDLPKYSSLTSPLMSRRYSSCKGTLWRRRRCLVKSSRSENRSTLASLLSFAVKDKQQVVFLSDFETFFSLIQFDLIQFNSWQIEKLKYSTFPE